jgi:glycosyltransferase involved in cell wall biosynthesis
VTHIAWLGKKSPFCGNVTYSLATTNALRQRGHQVSFIHFDTPATAVLNRSDSFSARARLPDPSAALTELTPESPEVTLPYLVKSQVYTIPSPGALRELRESLERLRPDVVHASLTLSPLDFRLPDLCQQLGVPLVATFHPPFDANLRNITAGTQQLTYQVYAPSLARYDRVIVFSELQADLLERLGVPQTRLAVIPNGVDTDTWTPAGLESQRDLIDLRQRFGRRRVFLYMGRLSTEKNVEALLKAWRLVRPSGCVLLIVGDGPLRSALQHNDDDVLWWGYEADLQRRVSLLQLAEVFLLPSLVEGLSLALLPVLRDQPVLTAELGRRARARVLERYTLSRNIDAIEALYRDLTRHPMAAA